MFAGEANERAVPAGLGTPSSRRVALPNRAFSGFAFPIRSCSFQPVLQRASCMLLTLGLGGCYSLVEAGYGNAASGRTGGVATGAVRLGLGDPREGSGARLMSVETALRVDASGAATRGAMGFGAVFVSQGGRFTPFARPAVWIAPFRGGDARHDNVVLPSLDLGALF